MSIEGKYKKLGKILVEKLRDENFKNYLEQSNYAKSLSLKEYFDLPRNSEYDPELQKIDDERFEFLNSLNNKQTEQLDKLILKTLDESAFNFLREVEERLIDNKGLGLIFEGDSIEDVYEEFLSGTFFGEYFLWVTNYSKYGEYQY